MPLTDFVLVPGAWLGGWAWKRVIPILEEAGHTTYPVTLTGEGERVHLASREVGLDTCVQDVLNVIRYNQLDRFVVVGHSFAGKVAAAVADREHDRVDCILYVDAFRPQKVRTPQGKFDPTQEFGSLKPGEFAIPFSEKIIENIGKDVKGEDRKWLLSMATPWPVKPANDPLVLSEDFDSVKNSFVFCTGGGDSVDEILSGKWGKIDGPYKVIDSGHWPMITKPEELAADMIELTV
jgi:pimeloyl-ACP methyl ester carboxylesterase